MAQSYNLPDGYKGDTYKAIQFTLSINGVVEDLTGYAIRSIFRLETKTGTEVLDFAIGTGITLTDATNGIFTIDAFAMTLDANLYYYDIEFTDASSVINTYICGQLTVIQDVTYE